jgi:hypothetical protein
MNHRGARLRVQTDGETRHYEVSSVLGDPTHPMKEADVVDKALKYGLPVLGDRGTHALIRHILHDPLDTILSPV